MKMLDKFEEKYSKEEPYIARKGNFPFRSKFGALMIVGGFISLVVLGMSDWQSYRLIAQILTLFLMSVVVLGVLLLVKSNKIYFYTDIISVDGCIRYRLVIMRGTLFRPFKEEKVKQLFESFVDAEAYYELGSDWDIEPE